MRKFAKRKHPCCLLNQRNKQMIGCLCSASTVICGMCSWFLMFLMFLMFLQNESGSSEVSEASSGRSGSSGSSGSRGLAAASAADSGIPRFGASHELLGLLAWPQSVHFNTEEGKCSIASFTPSLYASRRTVQYATRCYKSPGGHLLPISGLVPPHSLAV